jgi:Tol biopolymer transport system component
MTGTGDLHHVRPEGALNPSLFNSDGSVSWAWSPVSDCVVFALEKKGVWVFAPDGVGRRRIFDGLVSRFAFSPDGDQLAFVQDDTENEQATLSIASLTNGKTRRLTRLDVASEEEIVLAG